MRVRLAVPVLVAVLEGDAVLVGVLLEELDRVLVFVGEPVFELELGGVAGRDGVRVVDAVDAPDLLAEPVAWEVAEGAGETDGGAVPLAVTALDDDAADV